LPFATPHLLSAGSQLALAQRAAATSLEQTPLTGGMCPVTVGKLSPFATFAAQVEVCVLQN